MSDERAVNTVVDVSFALLFIGVAIAVFATLPVQDEAEIDPREADQTADVLGSSTVSTTYSIEELAEEATDGDPRELYDNVDLTRTTHGTISSQIGAIAVETVEFGDGSDAEPLIRAQTTFRDNLDTSVQTALVGSNFETAVSAHWALYEDSTITGTATVGQDPPVDSSISATHIAVPSGMKPVRERALSAVENQDDFDIVADLLAESVIEGYFPEFESKRALESSGIERAIIVQYYERMATVIDEADPDANEIENGIQAGSADPAAINGYLADALAIQIEAELSSQFDTAQESARAVSIGTVTLSVRTWEP